MTELEELRAENERFRSIFRFFQKSLAYDNWIKTAEALPKLDFNGYFIANGEYPSFIVMIREGIEATLLQFDGNTWFDDNGNIYNVTHWMAKPEPPKEGKK